jgi:hypothetical protein
MFQSFHSTIWLDRPDPVELSLLRINEHFAGEHKVRP